MKHYSLIERPLIPGGEVRGSGRDARAVLLRARPAGLPPPRAIVAEN